MSGRLFFVLIINIIVIFGFPHLAGLLFNHPYVSTVVVDVTPYSFDENHYAARIQKSYNSGRLTSDAYTYEYRDYPFIFSPGSTLILGYFAKIFGSVQNLFIAADFVFPPLIFFVLFLLFQLFLKHNYFALVGASFVLLEDQIVGHIKPFFFFLLNTSVSPLMSYFKSISSAPFYSRLENPQFSSIFFFASLYFLLYLFLTQSSSMRVRFLFVGSTLLLVYAYPFYAIYIMLLFGFFVVWNLVKNCITVRSDLLCLFILLLGCLPYIYQVIHLYQLPQIHELSVRWGQEKKWPYVPPSAVVTLGIVVLTSIRMKDKKNSLAATVLIIVTILSMYIFRVQTDHFITRILVPILRLIQIWLLLELLQWILPSLFNKFIKLLALVSIVVIICNAWIHAWFYTKNQIGYFTLTPARLEAYHWLAKNLSSDSVILSLSVQTNFQLPAFVPVYTFLPYAMLTFVPQQEIVDRLQIAYKAVNAKDEDLRAVLGISPVLSGRWKPSAENIEQKGGYIYYTMLAQKKEGYGLDQEELQKFLKSFNQIPVYSFTEISKRYRLDYIFWGPYERAHYSLQTKDLEPVFNNSQITIYKIRKNEL